MPSKCSIHVVSCIPLCTKPGAHLKPMCRCKRCRPDLHTPEAKRQRAWNKNHDYGG